MTTIASATPGASRVPKADGAGKLLAGWFTAAVLLTDLGLGAGVVAGDLVYGSGANTLARLGIGTAGQLLVAGASAPAWSGTGLTYDSASPCLTISAATAASVNQAALRISRTMTDSTGCIFADFRPTWTPSAGNANQGRALSTSWTINASAGALTAAVTAPNAGVRSYTNVTAGSVTALAGYSSWIDNTGSGTITHLSGYTVVPFTNTGGGTITNAYGLLVNSFAVGTNRFGIDIGNISGGTTNFAIRTGTGLVQFGDQVSITNGTAAAPGIKTSENHGLYRFSSTALGFAAAGIAVANITNSAVMTLDAGASGGSLTVGSTSGTAGSITILRSSVPCLAMSCAAGGAMRLQQPSSASNILQVTDVAGGNIYLTVTPAGMFTATDGRLGVGAGASSAVAVNVAQAALTGTSQYGLLMSVAATSAATVSLQMVSVAPSTAAASFTCGQVQGFRYQNVSIGAGSAVTTQYAIRIDALSGATNNYAFSSAGAGLVSIGDTTASASATTGALTVAGGVGIGGTINAANDTDIVAVIGRCKIGYDGANADAAVFAHFDRMSTTDRALVQGALGQTILNAASGQTVALRIANTTVATVAATAFTLAAGAILTVSDTTDATTLSAASTLLAGGLATAAGKSILSGGKILSLGATHGIGYGTGAGGTVTQGTSRTTGVTLNKVTGRIALFTAAGSATPTTFTVTCSACAETDTVVVTDWSGAANTYIWKAKAANGSFDVTFWTTGGTTSDAPGIHFNIIKGAIS